MSTDVEKCAEERRILCFHEAGHAVVFALGGFRIDGVYVDIAMCPSEWRDEKLGGVCVLGDYQSVVSLDKRFIRAQLCGTLAGNIAQGIFRGETQRILAQRSEGDTDYEDAVNIAKLLPDGDFSFYLTWTWITLQKYWPTVERLARQLECLGFLEGELLRKYLPKHEKDCPPVPGEGVCDE